MTHRFPIKEIAAQSGMSTATIDRVLNGRAHVSAQSRARVAAAIRELETQEGQLAARGRRMFVDVIVEAPDRFSRELRAAAEAVLPLVTPAVIRLRFTLQEVMDVGHTVAILQRIARRGSDGVCLKARDHPEIRSTIAELQRRGIPVVTIVTDVPGSERLAYAGLDNARAGRTAAQLMARHVQAGHVLTTQSHVDFQGESARIASFAAEMSVRASEVRLLSLEDAGGLNVPTAAALAALLSDGVTIAGVYSGGGGNRAIAGGLADLGAARPVFIAHDLDADNLALLEQDVLSYVLYHDLQADALAALRHVVAAHGLIAAQPETPTSDVQIIVPGNIPQRFR